MMARVKIPLLVCWLMLLATGAFSLELGRAWLEPEKATVNEIGDWTVHYEVGKMGIATGGGIRIQFPHAWFVHPWGSDTVKKVQTAGPQALHYASVAAPRKSVGLEIEIGKEGVDGQRDRWQHVFTLRVVEGVLKPGERVSFTFGRTPVPRIAESDAVQVGVDPSGNQTFIALKEFPTFTVHPGAAEKFLVFLPSQAAVNETVQLRIVALDGFNNRAESYGGTVEIQGIGDGESQSYTFSELDRGVCLMPVKFSTSGVHTVQVRDPQLSEGKVYESNPIKMVSDQAELKAYWGDLHSHCGISKDGVGRAETAFLNARDVFGLDFYALTDHSVGDKIAMDDWTKGILPQEWELTQKLVRSFYEPYHFVTFLAYEWSSPAPHGHHNIYFKTDTAPFFDLKHHRSTEELWAKLKDWECFTVPHHTAIMWRGINSPFVDWGYHNDEMRPAVELYSLHGACEYFNNPMKYEEMKFTPVTSNFGPYYAQDGWAMGNYLGTMASSDEHTAHPGQPHGGLTCILAPELTREALFEAVMKRQTYGTTGARILLDFRINGRMMGEQFTLAEGGKPEVTIEMVGTAALEFVELLRFDGKEWRVVQRWEPEGESRQLKLSWTDEEPAEEGIYYCRLKQKGNYWGREVRAWSSPIWVKGPQVTQ